MQPAVFQELRQQGANFDHIRFTRCVVCGQMNIKAGGNAWDGRLGQERTDAGVLRRPLLVLARGCGPWSLC